MRVARGVGAWLAAQLLLVGVVGLDDVAKSWAILAVDDASCSASVAERAAAAEAAPLASSDVLSAVRRGWWGCAEQLAELAASAGLTGLENQLALEARTIEHKISRLRAIVEPSATPSQTISPAFQWAQSGESVFLNVKFAHKIDAPATLDVSIDDVTLTNSTLRLSATKEQKAFELSLSFSGEIVPELSSWSAASVGRVVFTLKKKGPRAKWASLLGTGAKKPSNMHMWWDKQEQYSDELDDLEDDEEAPKKKPSPIKVKKSTKKSSEARTKGKPSGANDPTAEAAAEAPPPKLTEDKPLTSAERGKQQAQQDAASSIEVVEADAQRQKQALDEEGSQRKGTVDQELARKSQEILDAAEAKRASRAKAEL